MKSLWRSAWALERRSPALLPVTVYAAAVPGTRRGRKATAGQSFAPDSRGLPDDRPGPLAWEKLERLKRKLEAQAQEDETPSSEAPASKTGIHDRGSRTDSQYKKKRNPNQDERYGLFKRLVVARFAGVVRASANNSRELSALGLKDRNDLNREAHMFKGIIHKAFELASRSGITGRQQNPYFWSWRNAFINGDTKTLHTEIQHSFTSFVVRQHLSKDAIACHERLADFRFPHEWFPATRTMQRTIHLHVGPTNSGKTYNALQALEKSKTGIYAGPLRLLAHETFMRFQAKGKRCALVTGEEMRIPEGDDSYFASCTVEMTPLNKRVDVAVIDEIQMIGDNHRGWAWTQALLGVQAKEVHLCGEERAVPLVEALCAKIGDEVIVHRYKRLSSLQPMQESMDGKFENLRKGDAIVSFSRVNLHTLKAGIEAATGRKCAIVYGALPPESRAQQAALFNDPNNDYDFLAASDAIGMGLNLEIKRVVFESVAKHDGIKIRALTVPEMKQIGGRAGRYRTATQAMQASVVTPTAEAQDAVALQPSRANHATQVGFVTTMEEEDLNEVHQSFTSEVEPLQTAGLFPPGFILEKFASYFPAGTPFTFMLLRLRDIARLPGRFHMCNFKSHIDMAQVTEPFPLSIHDRCIFLNAPVSFRDYGMIDVVKALARRVAHHESGELLDIKEIQLEILDFTRTNYPAGRGEYLRHLEALHKALTLYLWLSYRYVGIFQSQGLAFHVKALVEERINKYLENLDYSQAARQERLASNRRSVSRQSSQYKKVLGDDGGEAMPAESEGLGVWTEESHEEPLLSGVSDAEVAPPAQNANP